jgi:cell division protein FtsA
MIRLPVRVGSPNNLAGLPERLHNPAYATAVGLVLWAAKQDAPPLWQSKHLGFLRVFSLVTRLRNLFNRKKQ